MSSSALTVIGLQYLEANISYPDRAIYVKFSDEMHITFTDASIEGIMSHPQMQPYSDQLSNILVNETEHWFAGKEPRISSALLF